MMKETLKRAMLLAWSLQGPASAMIMQDPATDFAFLEFEPYPSFGGGDRFSGPVVQASDKRAWRLAGQLSFPAGKIGSNQLFGSFKSTLMDRDIIYHDTILNDGVLQRYWLSGGSTWPGRGGQSSMALVGVGVNSDFADIGFYDFNTEWIYAHFWTPSPAFNWGLGLDVQQYFHKYEPYPLIFVDWKLTDRTKLKWDADFLEVRRFLNPWLCFTAGVRFNLEFFALQRDADFEYNSMGLETGFQYAVGGNCYARIKYKELVWGRETLGVPDGGHHTRNMAAGRSLRLNFAYGL
ncbi:MAG TPA: DUF6268 family outer membrane beta-barrel protein [Fibrobacteria bacterium]|nr:DUF6268 family outer membrane beta-barrel protein [Fibrobacteria bacterium]